MTNWLGTPVGTTPPISLVPALEAASNMIYYLSSEAAHYPSGSLIKSAPPRQFTINAPALAVIRFAIDPYWACHAFAAVFLALLYDRGAIDGMFNHLLMSLHLTLLSRRAQYRQLAQATQSTTTRTLPSLPPGGPRRRHIRYDMWTKHHPSRCSLSQNRPKYRPVSVLQRIQPRDRKFT